MPPQPPWTDTGRLQQDISDVQRQLHNKAESYELTNINSKLHSLESTVVNLESTISDLRYQVEDLIEKVRTLEWIV